MSTEKEKRSRERVQLNIHDKAVIMIGEGGHTVTSDSFNNKGDGKQNFSASDILAVSRSKKQIISESDRKKGGGVSRELVKNNKGNKNQNFSSSDITSAILRIGNQSLFHADNDDDEDDDDSDDDLGMWNHMPPPVQNNGFGFTGALPRNPFALPLPNMPSLPEMPRQMMCMGCGFILLYTRGATSVGCPRCFLRTPVPSSSGMEMFQGICRGCGTMQNFPRGTPMVKCFLCHRIAFV